MRARALAVVLIAGCGFSAADPSGPAAGGDGGPGPGPGVDAPTTELICADLDNNGACDDQTWRCGASPTSPGDNPLFGNITSEALWAHDVSLAKTGHFTVAVAGKPILLEFRYDWKVDCPGSSCQAQVEYGLVASGVDQREGCAADRQMIDRTTEWNQNAAVMIDVPAASGIYDVRLELAKQSSCGTAWSTPSGSHTIAKICVP